MPPSGLLNITHGERKNGVKPAITPRTQSTSFQGNQNFRTSQTYSENKGSSESQNFLGNQVRNSNWFSYSDIRKNGPQQASGSGSYSGLLAGNQSRNYHDNRGGYSNQSRGGWEPMNQDRNQMSGPGHGRGQNWNRGQQENKSNQRQVNRQSCSFMTDVKLCRFVNHQYLLPNC